MPLCYPPSLTMLLAPRSWCVGVYEVWGAYLSIIMRLNLCFIQNQIYVTEREAFHITLLTTPPQFHQYVTLALGSWCCYMPPNLLELVSCFLQTWSKAYLLWFLRHCHKLPNQGQSKVYAYQLLGSQIHLLIRSPCTIIAAAMSLEWRSKLNIIIWCISFVIDDTGSRRAHWLFLYTTTLCPRVGYYCLLSMVQISFFWLIK